MNFKILAFLGIVLFLATDPSLGKETNASRFRRGLPPLPPRFVVRSKGATASTTVSSRPSSTPRPFSSRSGRIQVFANNGSFLGYVRNSTPIGVNLAGDPKQELRIETVSTNPPFDIVATNLRTSESHNLALHQLMMATLSNVRSTSPAIRQGIQSATWSINPNTQELEAQYVEPDGTKSYLYIAYDTDNNELHFIDDINLANLGFAVKLYFSED